MQIADLQEKIKCLEGATDELQQYSRRNSLRISGIIETEYEDVCGVTLNTFKKELKVDPPVEVCSIDRVHRVGPREAGKPMPVLGKFATYRDRSRIFKAKSTLRKKSRQDVPHTQSLYINEDLSKRRATRLWNAREKKREGKINDCWTIDGRILIKTSSNKILTMKDLDELEKLWSDQ